MKVFLSFTGLLGLMRCGKIKEEDLQGAVFYFGCAREHLFPEDLTEPNKNVEAIFRDDPGAGAKVLAVIREKVLDAEAKGWVGFRHLLEHNSLADLNDILALAALPEIQWTNDMAHGYSYPVVIRIAEEQGHPAQFFG